MIFQKLRMQLLPPQQFLHSVKLDDKRNRLRSVGAKDEKLPYRPTGIIGKRDLSGVREVKTRLSLSGSLSSTEPAAGEVCSFLLVFP